MRKNETLIYLLENLLDELKSDSLSSKEIFTCIYKLFVFQLIKLHKEYLLTIDLPTIKEYEKTSGQNFKFHPSLGLLREFLDGSKEYINGLCNFNIFKEPGVLDLVNNEMGIINDQLINESPSLLLEE